MIERRAIGARRLVAALAMLSPALAADDGVRVQRQWALMGTVARFEGVAPTRAEALTAGETVLDALRETEARLSTWRSDSELSLLNRGPVGRPVALSAELARDLELAAEWSRSTGGAFSPYLGALIAAWDLRGGGRVPAPERWAEALEASRPESFVVSGGTAVRRHRLAAIEEGGFGKGRALDVALDRLASTALRSGWIDLGGQVAVFGGAGREVLVASPNGFRQPLFRLSVDRGSVATSGNGERFLEIDGRRFGHILEPGGGRPAPDFGSMTVWAPTATAADCLATALYVLGPEAGLRWVSRHPESGALALALERRGAGYAARASCGLRGRLLPFDRASIPVTYDCRDADGARRLTPSRLGE